MKFASTILFADDANLYASHKNLKTLFSEMNKDIENLVTWFKANILFLNICKTFLYGIQYDRYYTGPKYSNKWE